MAFDWLKKYYTPDVKDEMQQILNVSWPLIMASLWSYLLSPVALMFCGHLGTTVLDGVSLAGSLINISGISIVTGLSAACDTFFSQTYGSGNYYQLGIYLQRSLLIIGFSLLPCWAFQINARAFLTLIAQDPAVLLVAAEYLDKFLFGLPGCFAFILLSKYLQNQDILYPTIIIGAIGNGLNALLHYLLIWVADMGFDGSAYAMAISFDVMGIMSAAYILIWKVYDNDWPGWGRHSLTDWGAFMQLAVPSLIMICVESWTIEIGVFLSGLVSVTQQSAQSILFQVQTITDMLTIGFGSASSIRIGQHLGRGDYQLAKISATLCILLTFAMATVLTSVIGGLCWEIPYLFSDDPAVVAIVAKLLPILGLYAFTDALSATSGGIVRGCGRQVAGSIINIIGYYGIALPVGIPLLLVFQVIDPLWYSLFGALAVTSVIYIILILRTNWKKQADLAAERANAEDDAEQKMVETFLVNFAGGRRTTWATLSDNPLNSTRFHSAKAASHRIDHSRYSAIDGPLSAPASHFRPVSGRASLPGSGLNTRPTSMLDPEGQHTDALNNPELESSFTASQKSNVSVADDETTGLISGEQKGKRTPSVAGRIRAGLEKSSDSWGMTREEFGRLIFNRILAVLICFGLLGASLALRLTILDFGPLSNDNMTTLPTDNNITTSMAPPITLTSLEYTSTVVMTTDIISTTLIENGTLS